MSVPFFGDYDTTETVVIPFNAFTSNDPSASVTVTNLASTDVEIYKDGSLTERSSAGHDGIAVDIDVDGVVGSHWVTIDLSDNDDDGFYANGSNYQVMMVGTTIDGGTVNAWIGAFSIGRMLRPTTAGRKLTVESDGVGHADLKEWLGVAPLALSSQQVQTDLTAIHGTALTETATQLAGAFVKFFNVASPTATALSLPDAVPGAAGALVTGDGTVTFTAGVGGRPAVDAEAISGDTTAANNLELQYDTTGLSGATFPASQAQADRNADLSESGRGYHTWQGNIYYVAPVNGNDSNAGTKAAPRKTIQSVHDNLVTDSNHDVIILLADAAAGVTTLTEDVAISKRYVFIRGPGRDFIWRPTANNTVAATITADGVELSGFQLAVSAAGTGGQHGIQITGADFARIHNIWFLATRGDGVNILRGSNCQICHNHFDGTGVNANGQGIHIVGTAGTSDDNVICDNHFSRTGGDSILIENGTTNDTVIRNNEIHDSVAWGINIGASSADAVVHDNVMGNNASGNINDGGTTSIIKNNNAWLYSTTEGRSLKVTAAGLLGTGVIEAATFAAGAINAAAIADAAIDNATFAADVGTTVYASNTIALAVRKVLDELNLDHLLKVVTAAADMTTEVADNTILSRILSNGDTSVFVPSTDGLQPSRDENAAIKVITDALTAAAAAKLAISAGTIVEGTVSHDNTASTTTVFYADDITEATADHYNGRIVIFTSGAVQNQASDITDYELSAGEGKITVTALTEAPADNVTFVIL